MRQHACAQAAPVKALVHAGDQVGRVCAVRGFFQRELELGQLGVVVGVACLGGPAEGGARRAVEVHRLGQVVGVHEGGPGLADQPASVFAIGVAQAQAVAVALGAAVAVEIGLDLGVERAVAHRGGGLEAEARGLAREHGLAVVALAQRLLGKVGEVVARCRALEVLDQVGLGKTVHADRGFAARQAEAPGNVAQHHGILLLELHGIDTVIPGRCRGGRRLCLLGLELVELGAQGLELVAQFFHLFGGLRQGARRQAAQAGGQQGHEGGGQFHGHSVGLCGR